MTKRRIVAAILGLLILVVMLSSSLFIIEHADHDCVGEDCPICEQICFCERMLKTLSLAVVAAVAIFVFAVSPHTDCRQAETIYVPHTLVSLKVKLSN